METMALYLRSLWLATAVHLWQTTLVLAAIFALSRFLRGAPAAVQYLLWSLAFIKLFLPMAVLGSWCQSLLVLITPALASYHATVGIGALKVLTGLVNPAGAWAEDVWSLSSLTSILLVLLTLFWVAGISWRVIRLLGDYHRGRGILLAGTTGAPSSSDAKLMQALRATSIPSDRVVLTNLNTTPCVLGLLRPRILLPRVLVGALRLHELRAILLHEEAHRRRRDPLRATIVTAASAVYFFYPLLGALRRRLQQTAEQVCDESVIRQGVAPKTYARALARTIGIGLGPAVNPLSAATESGSFLGRRLHRIRAGNYEPIRRRHYLSIVLAFSLVLGGSFLPVQFLTGCARDVADSPKAAQSGGERVSQAPADPVAPVSDAGSGAMGDSSHSSDALSDTSRAHFQTWEEAPALISLPPPVYPDEAKKKGIEGVVQMRLLVDREGRVAECFAVEPANPLLAKAATESARQAKFKPATSEGRPVEVWVQVPMRFSLH